MELKFFKEKEDKKAEKDQEEKSDIAGKIIDLMAERYAKGGKIETFPEKEAVEKILETDKFIEILGELVKEKQEKGEKPHIILATYNRVGKGNLPQKISRPDLNLDIWSASPDVSPSEKEIKEFFKKATANLERQLIYMENGPLVIFYSGSGENFNLAAETIDHLNSLTEILDEEKKPKFFLLTCHCALEEKIKAALPLIQAGRLEGLVYGKEKDCGGFNDLEKIAESLVGKEDKEPLN